MEQFSKFCSFNRNGENETKPKVDIHPDFLLTCIHHYMEIYLKPLVSWLFTKNVLLVIWEITVGEVIVWYQTVVSCNFVVKIYYHMKVIFLPRLFKFNPLLVLQRNQKDLQHLERDCLLASRLLVRKTVSLVPHHPLRPQTGRSTTILLSCRECHIHRRSRRWSGPSRPTLYPERDIRLMLRWESRISRHFWRNLLHNGFN